MVLNYLKSLFRVIARNKFYTALNITGLSVGIAAATFMMLYIQDEVSYDQYHEKHERIFRIESDFNINNKHDKFAIVPFPMGPAMKIEFPEIEEFVRLTNVGNTLFRFGEKEYYEENVYLCDSTVFDVFTYRFILGGPEKSLTEPNTIVLTQTIANKYFGNENPLGEIMISGTGNSYKVTAVLEDIPGNSHLRFDALISAATIAEETGVDEFNSLEPIRFWNIGVYTYLLLKENSDMQSIYEKWPAFYEKYMKPVGDQINASFELMSTPLIKTHFRQGIGSDLPSGNMAYIYIFSAVAVFILLIAAINYMNLATARSANRAREVGMRKVLGAHRVQLIRQFLGESLVMAVFAMIIAIAVIGLFLPDFNNLAGKSIRLTSMPLIMAEIGLIAILTGLLSGSYPAFYLSSFVPVKVLKGKPGASGKKGGWLRRFLVVIQFFIAIVFIIATIVVSTQLKYLKNKDMGFNKKDLVVMEIQDSAFRSRVQTFKKELLQNPHITAATNTTGVPGNINWIQVLKIEQEEKMEDKAIILSQTDYDFARTMELEFMEGRDFDEKMGTDALEAVIINETAAREFNWGKEALGKKIHYGFELDGTGGRIMKVIGVVKDFHFNSLHNKVEPFIFFLSERPRFFLSCRIDPDHKTEALAFIEEKWDGFNAKRPFDFQYLEQSMDEMYKAEEKLARIFRIATILTIFIALLGLLGLSSYIAEQRTKEIGVRKVLGASVGNILNMMYREFLILILIAFALSIPVAWWRLDIWLQDTFVYHTPVQWTSFVLAGALALVIGLATISFYILRAATGNPVDAIKYE
ncbi:MAG: ABC transporter permease [Bacteroidales bacterium]|nr:ABC transporter permease [Bacteroidales bacterium]